MLFDLANISKVLASRSDCEIELPAGFHKSVEFLGKIAAIKAASKHENKLSVGFSVYTANSYISEKARWSIGSDGGVLHCCFYCV